MLARFFKIVYSLTPLFEMLTFILEEINLKHGSLRAELTCLFLALALATAAHWAIYNYFDHDQATVNGAACPVTFKS